MRASGGDVAVVAILLICLSQIAGFYQHISAFSKNHPRHARVLLVPRYDLAQFALAARHVVENWASCVDVVAKQKLLIATNDERDHENAGHSSLPIVGNTSPPSGTSSVTASRCLWFLQHLARRTCQAEDGSSARTCKGQFE